MEKIKNFVKMNKKVLIPVLAVLIILLAGAAVSAAVNLDHAEDGGLKPTEQKEETQKSKTAKASDKKEDEDENVQETVGETAESSAPEDTKTDVANDREQTDKNKSADSGSAGSAAENSSKSSGGSRTAGESGGAGSSKSSHTHKWADHTAQKQVWVSNMVTVDDYETKTIYGARFYTPSGNGSMIANGPTYWFENGFTHADLKNIIANALRNADSNGLYNGVYYGNYQNVSKTERVKTGSHQEDQGHYENQTYVDYQYCTVCGEKK